ncbi:SGNH/GDSL hydrolase family protein [Calidifontibacter sp. DB0510]|uniref:SGNH/GDSL hydrolase family protein n=1 Tax=Metallococcus carri TaxID=1656884 RepID=A0A967B4F9_9MICO|nr:SGNH/GDSL hydrolase family protein [Metallococcus carri]NHN57100.1 SGNH/GDSL hydrolase family protein [Metallococcus carri]NOP39031.1 SGNH/GDSL hydrolase family protein [Calidifontibacter sp. DB2511S]
MAGRFVAVGDSFTEGVGDPNLLYPNGVRGWACRMARQMGRADERWEYANLAIRSKLLDEVVAEQLEPALALRPTLVSFYAGGNDILSLRVDMRGLMQRYEDALRRLTAGADQVVVFTAFDLTTSVLLEPIRRRLMFYNRTVQDLAASYGALVVDHSSIPDFADPRMWSTDRIHMSRAGHKTLAGVVLRNLGIPHTLKIPELPPFEPRHWRTAVREESLWVRDEVFPLLRRRMTGAREGDALAPKWPDPIRPADGMKRLARERAGDAQQVHAEALSNR